MEASPGWYPDPSGRFPLRFWNGVAWTDRAQRDGYQYRDELPPRADDARPSRPTSPSAVGYRAEHTPTGDQLLAYLDDAFARGLVDSPTHDRLRADAPMWTMGGAALFAPAPPVPDRPPPPPVPNRPPATAPPAQVDSPLRAPPAVAPAPLPAPPAAAAAGGPWFAPPAPSVPLGYPAAPGVPGATPAASGPVRSWWTRTRAGVSADLAVNGLAYLGTLLVFAGVFGFVVFAYQDVQVGLRPIAELSLPVAFFGSAWLLRRRGIAVVSAALELLGGAITPIVVIASLVDGASPPPDLDGTVLVVVLASTLVVISLLYLLVALRRPTSALRFLIGPTMWLAFAAAGLLFSPTIPSGSAIAHPSPGQWALVCSAIATTLLACRWLQPPSTSPGPAIIRATSLAAVPGVFVAEVVTVLASAGQGWPAAAIAVAGVATIISLDVLDVLDRRLPSDLVVVAQAVTLYVSAAALAPTWGAATSGAIVAIGTLLLYELDRLRRPTTQVAILASSLVPGAAIALVIALEQPWTALVAFVLASAWAVVRHLLPGRPPVPGALTATIIVVAPLGAASGLIRLTSLGTTLVVVAVLAVLAALAVRSTSDRDPLWAGWIPGAAAAVVGLSVSAAFVADADELGRLPAAAVLAAAAFALAPRWPAFRVWTTATAMAAALAVAAMTWSWPTSVSALAIAGIAVVPVAAAARWREPIAGHIGLAGHLGTLFAIPVSLTAFAERSWNLESIACTVALAAWTLGLVLTATVAATRGSSVTALVDRVLDALSGSPPTSIPSLAPAPARGTRSPGLTIVVGLVAASTPFLSVAVAAIILGPTGDAAWLAVAAVATVVGEAVAARALSTHRPDVATTVASTGLALAVVALVVTSADDLAATVGSALFIAAVVAVGPIARRAFMTWFAWAASAMVAVFGTAALGLPAHLVPEVVLEWGAVALLGSLALDDVLAGRRSVDVIIRRRELRPGVVLGPVALATGLLAVLGQDPSVAGWWWLGGAVAVAVAAWQLRWGAVTAVSFVLATGSYAMLAPWHPLDVPWTLVPVVAVLVLVAEVVHTWWPLGTGADATGREPATVTPDGTPPLALPPRFPTALTRWDQAPLVVAHLVALVALAAALAVDADAITTTWCGIGAIAVALDARRRTGVWATGGALLVLVGAGTAGWGWLSLALAVTSAATTAGAVRADGPARRVLQSIGPAAAAGAWIAMLAWRQADLELSVEATALATAALALALATTLRLPHPDRGWTAMWAVLVPVGLWLCLVPVLAGSVQGSPSGAIVGAALAATAIAAGLSAGPAALPVLRDATALLLSAAALDIGMSLPATPNQIVAVAGSVGVLATLGVSVVASGRGPWTAAASRWIRPGLLLAGVATATSLLTALVQLPERPLLIIALLLVGLDLAALGVTRRWSGALTVAPVPVLAAWLVFASESLTGNPQWFTVPIGVTLLAVVALARRGERQVGHDPAAAPIVLLDLLGCILVVSAALAQTVVDSVAYGLLAAGLGAAIAAWGVLSQVRRRVEFGAATVTVAAALLVLVPLAGLLPNVSGPALWLALAGVGLVAIVVAAVLEQGRALAHRSIERFREATKDWEGWSAPHPPASTGI